MTAFPGLEKRLLQFGPFFVRTISDFSYIPLKNIIYKQFLSFLAHRILRKGFLPAINHGEFQIIFCILDQPVNFHQSK